MFRCPNCGHKSYVPGLEYRCGCTWLEQAAAARIKERERRERLAKQGRPVAVDFQRPWKDAYHLRVKERM
jgi:hypothetical protein